MEATYNGVRSTLAPHVLYLRAGQPYVAAVTVLRRGLPPTARRLGVFAVGGLSDGRLTEAAFAVDPAYAPRDPRWAEHALFAVEA